jgi:hypothetical protein
MTLSIFSVLHGTNMGGICMYFVVDTYVPVNAVMLMCETPHT